MSMTPFEIRLELLKMSKEMLTEEYYSKKEQLTSDWSTKVEAAKLSGSTPPEHPQMPAYPTEAEIITKATTLNGFVSQVSAQPTTNSKSRN